MSTKATNIKFVEYHQPGLPVGEYKVTVTQTLEDIPANGEGKKITTENTHTVAKTFFVAGERFHINPGEIGAVFPPANSVGEHSLVFPHIVLNRSTLPWERMAHANDDESKPTPWLALLVIYEKEENDAKSKIEKLDTIRSEIKATVLEPGQSIEDNIAVLSIKRRLLEKILPGKRELRYLAHTRHRKDIENETEIAVLMANRLPQKSQRSTVHLVSLENRYGHGDDGKFDYGDKKADECILLVRLHSWSFHCTEHFKISQSGLNKTADQLPEKLKETLEALIDKEFFTEKDFIESLKLTSEEVMQHKKMLKENFSFGDFATILKHLDRDPSTLRLPDVNSSANKYLKMGFYPLPHRLRGGGQTVSWYHGPLCTGSDWKIKPGRVRCADALLRYYQENGMFDVSYAAAWELGRLLALQNSNFSVELYKWKREHIRSTHKSEQHRKYQTTHLHGANRDHNPPALPASLETWLNDLCLLKGVPFAYLVPDEKLLPAESIRFFKMDSDWIAALCDGALSIGRVTSKDYKNDGEVIDKINIEEKLFAGKISGFIIRSEAVSGWPGLQIEGYDTKDPDPLDSDTKALSVLRDEKLSPNVRLCLFDGDLQTLSLHLKPEMLHFGVDQNEHGYENKANISIPIQADEGVLKIDHLIKGNNFLTSAHLAKQLLQGVACVQWKVSTS